MPVRTIGSPEASVHAKRSASPARISARPARIDGAGPVRRFLTITLPLLTPALVIAAAFRMLDALRQIGTPPLPPGGAGLRRLEQFAAGGSPMLDLFIGFVVGCAIGYFAREMLSAENAATRSGIS